MEYRQREYPLFSACGLNCGLCPRYQMEGQSKCPGCSGEGFLTKHPPCGVLSCSQRRGLEYCFACEEYPCEKYDGADRWDSFITHRRQFRDMEKAKSMGIGAYKEELDEKIGLLEWLLGHCDDGRRKGLFCIAVNLLEPEDLRDVFRRIQSEIHEGMSQKEKAAAAASLLEETAGKRGIVLKLRKKPKA